MKEIVGTYNNIRFIKTEALENFFLSKIIKKKGKQLNNFLWMFCLDCFKGQVDIMLSAVVVISLFCGYQWLGNTITVSAFFTI